MLKKIILSIIIIISLSIPNFVCAQSDSNWIINNFHSDITVNKDASLNITETIEVDFYSNQKHGIFRYIPVKYKNKSGNNQDINLKIISIKDQDGNAYQFSDLYSSGNQEFKIGDADKYITGKNTYIINYKVNKAINYFDDHDELYWNVTGNDWPVIIENVSATINLPEGINQDQIQAKLYTGMYGSTSENGKINIENSKINYETNQELNPGQGFTIVAGWPVGIVHKPTFWENLWQTLINNIFYFLPVIVFFILLYLYFKHGRDPKGRGTIVPEFEVPKDLTPLEIGAIVDERIDYHDISASIIDLAIRKYLTIEVKEKKGIFGKTNEITLIKKKSPDIGNLNNFEKELLNGLFDNKNEVKLKDIKDFYTTTAKIKDQVFKKLTSDGYFPKHPTNTKVIYLSIGFMLVFASFFFPIFSISLAVGSFFSGIIIMCFAPFMPKKTHEGVLLKEKILGLKLYLKTAEKYRLKFQEKEQIFERFLPAATALGVAGIWAEKFKHIYKDNSPYWYHGYPGYVYIPTALSSDLNSMQSQVSAMTSTASSGGSGFSGGGSGGGFGGGGGGSW